MESTYRFHPVTGWRGHTEIALDRDHTLNLHTMQEGKYLVTTANCWSRKANRKMSFRSASWPKGDYSSTLLHTRLFIEADEDAVRAQHKEVLDSLAAVRDEAKAFYVIRSTRSAPRIHFGARPCPIGN